ncbi:MAG: ankyrin repeat domain-containing protein [Proteobacteria bacterium]|nr:ankyrin repeat domain-containing protein [Pseudomonadota bacterium]
MFPWIYSNEVIKILQLSKRQQQDCLSYFLTFKTIPWQDYPGCSLYETVRDYLILQFIKEKFENSARVHFETVKSLIKSLRLTQLIQQNTLPASTSFEQKYWLSTCLLQSIDAYNQRIEEHSVNKIKEKLIQLKYKPEQLDEQCRKLAHLVLHQSEIVITFDSKGYDFSSASMFSFFQTRKTNAANIQDEKSFNEYLIIRLSAETLHYLNAEPDNLQNFLMDSSAHPVYATLQFLVTPVTIYGNSFMVLDRSQKNAATAIFGSPIRKMIEQGIRLKPVRFTKSPYPLIAQFSDRLLKTCLETDQKKPFSSEFDIQFNNHETQYIEVQLLNNISLNNSGHVKHIHLDFNSHLPKFEKIDQWIDQGINISIGNNPFDCLAFREAYSSGEMAEFLLKETVSHIYRAALIIAETNESYLKLIPSHKALQFIFNITMNRPHLHQAQAAALLYQLGVRRYFTNIPAIAFDQKKIEYILPLTETSADSGALTDHDSYSENFYSLKKLLEKFLKKIFLIVLISFQNEQYYLLNNKPHPITGKGATEESNQTKHCHLGEAKTSYDIEVHWMFDRVVIEVISSRQQDADSVMANITKLFASKAKLDQFLIYIDLPLTKLLKKLQKSYYPYQSTIIYENKIISHYGDLLFAFRYGFTSPGGHNNDPYSWIGAVADIEFGKLIADWRIIEAHKKILNTTAQPVTIYYSLPTECLATIQEEADEFVPGSLLRIPVWRLGNLTSEEIDRSANICKLSSENYIKNFGRALLLRPVNSIVVYIHWAQQEIQEIISMLFYNTVKFSVEIKRQLEVITYNEAYYWKPCHDFGRIEIKGANHYIELLQKQVHDFSHSLSTQTRESTLVLAETNPLQLIQRMEETPIDLVCNDLKLTQRILKQLRTNSLTYLLQFKIDKISEIFMQISKAGHPWDQLLGEKGGEIALHLIKLVLPDSKADHSFLKKFVLESWGPLEKTTLHIATELHDLPAVKFLSEKIGIIPQARDKNWDTPLHYACQKADLELLQYFIIQRKAQLFLRNYKKQSLWFVAALSNNWQIVYFLTECLSKDPALPSNIEKFKKDMVAEAKSHLAHKSFLHLLINECKMEPNQFEFVVKQMLLIYHSIIKLPDSNGNTLLHLAVGRNDIMVTQLLIDAKADINPRNNEFMTPLDIANIHLYENVAGLLTKHGATPITFTAIADFSLDQYPRFGLGDLSVPISRK